MSSHCAKSTNFALFFILFGKSAINSANLQILPIKKYYNRQMN